MPTHIVEKLKDISELVGLIATVEIIILFTFKFEPKVVVFVRTWLFNIDILDAFNELVLKLVLYDNIVLCKTPIFDDTVDNNKSEFKRIYIIFSAGFVSKKIGVVPPMLSVADVFGKALIVDGAGYVFIGPEFPRLL